MRTIEQTLYKFDELNDSAKEKAIEKYRHINVDTDHWWEFVYENFIEDTKLFNVTKIYFSGFWSQGDGAMFEYNSISDDLRVDFINSLNLSPMRKKWLLNNTCVSANGKHSSRYYHERSCTHNIYFQVDNGDIHWSHNLYQLIESFRDDFEEYVIDKYVDLCRDLYKSLEKEYEFLTSDDSVIDFIMCNEYEFYEDGRSN